MCAILDHFVQQPVHDSLVQEPVKMVASPSHWLTLHTFIALFPSSNLECISWPVRPTCMANMSLPTHTHTHTLSLSLSLFLCVCRGVCVRTSVSETESLVSMNSCRFGAYFVLVPSHLRSAILVATVLDLFSRSSTFVVTVAEV